MNFLSQRSIKYKSSCEYNVLNLQLDPQDKSKKNKLDNGYLGNL